ncbi:MAG: ABC transporter substrate-binding protein [Chloroflexaceae bacterium]|nr:ABC transporter substrate-binding protein [Chloroflexaceae bacterium]
MLRIAQALSSIYIVVALGLLAFSIRPAPEPVTISVVYGTEKREWLEDAAARFAATNPTVNGRQVIVELEGLGSRDMTLDILQGNLQPTVISPASSIHTRFLRDEWRTRTGEDILLEGNNVPPLVITPLVVVAWEERANALWPDGINPDTFWDDIHAALVDPQGWAAYGHPEWGFIKFGHTRPIQSNSGIQTIVLLAYAFHDKVRNLETADILDPQFQEWLVEIENGVLEFGDSTGTYMNEMVLFGPSKYDFIVVYENLAIENFDEAAGRWGSLRVFYPPANILSDHPYAILNAEWVTEDQRAAAALFRDFLLSEEVQHLALVEHGFRPGNVAVSININGNPFEEYQDAGIQLDIVQSVEAPPAEVLNELIELWRRRINR